MTVRFSRNFVKQYKKTGNKIKEIFEIKLKIFFKNPLDSRLNNHQLKGRLSIYRSINVTGDWRALYSKKGETVIFEVIGTHSQLYR